MNKESDHFIGKDLAVKKIYKRLIDELIKFGFLRIEPKKSGIVLVNHKQFATVVVRASYVNVEFELNHMLDDQDGFVKIQKTSPTRFTHTIQLQREEDMRPKFFDWIREAYLLNG